MAEENPLARSQQLLWDGLPPSGRGPKPTLTLEQIVTTAIAVADADGFDALSMRKLAAELGMGTMSLYRYVPSKTELLHLMLDMVTAPPEGERGRPGTWLETLEAAAWGGRDLYLRHRWLLRINWSRPVLGPNSVADLEWVLSGLVDLPMSDKEKLMVVTQMDALVVGAVRQEIHYEESAAESGLTDEEFWQFQIPIMEQVMATGDYPVMAALSEDSFDGGWEESFAFGLRLFLDGLEREVGRRTA